MLIPTKQNVKTVTDMRQDALGLINGVQDAGPFYLMHKSTPKAVMLSIDDYTNLFERYWDSLDALEALELAKEPKGKGYTLKQIHEECL